MLKYGEGGRREEEVGDTGSCLGDGMRVRFRGGEDRGGYRVTVASGLSLS